jgi:hypothetical protein
VLAPLVGSQPLPRWARGHCWYPADQVSPRTGFKTTQGVGHASARCHVSCSSKPCLPIEVASDAAICPTTLDLATLLWWALVLPCGSLLRTSPPREGELRRCHVSHGTGPRFPAREGSDAATCHAVPYRSWASSIKKGLDGLAIQLGSHIPKTLSRVSKAPVPEQLWPARRVGRWHH